MQQHSISDFIHVKYNPGNLVIPRSETPSAVEFMQMEKDNKAKSHEDRNEGKQVSVTSENKSLQPLHFSHQP